MLRSTAEIARADGEDLRSAPGRLAHLGAVGRGLQQLVADLVLGLAAAFGVTRLMSSLLFRVSRTNPVVFVSVPFVLFGMGLVACWLPARRAAALHPVEALRYQ